MTTRNHERSSARRGSVLLAAIAVALVLAALAVSTLTVVHSVNQSTEQQKIDLQREYLAESAAGFAEIELLAGRPGDLGSEQAPVSFGVGGFWTTAVPAANNTITVTCNGSFQGGTKALSAIYRSTPGVFNNAIFAGNSSGDPNYVMHFGGVAGEADSVTGDIFSGGDIEFVGTSSINGMPSATGTVTGKLGNEGVTQAIPDLAAMNYASIADVNVVNEFVGATYKSNSAGGKAWQVAESNASHIFRKNPSDRATETRSTAKDDFFLEDPYEPVRSDSKSDGSDPYIITLAGTPGNPGSDGNHKVYYIDGNLWIHNYSTMSFQLDAVGDLAVTFVVRGNIYISDNIYYGDKAKDGLALIAMKDPAQTDSGNIYFGDTTFGTLEHMSAYMYAENNFLDTNMSATGSKKVSLDGIMSAGNQVAIQRDFRGHHSQLTVNFDSRVANSLLDLPGLPASPGAVVTFLGWQYASVAE